MEPASPAEAARTVVEPVATEARVGASVLRRHGMRLALVFALVALPLWGFGELAEDVLEGEPFAFDDAILQFLHAHATPALDGLFLTLSTLGYSGGVVPVDIVLVLALAFRRRYHAATFAMLATVGSALANAAAKHLFHRARPALWPSLAPEHTYSFPSGHAMGSATLACVVVILLWKTRWRASALVLGIALTLAIGVSRMYLGVHYPSDVLAGWTAAIAWTLGVYLVAFQGRFAFHRPARPG